MAKNFDHIIFDFICILMLFNKLTKLINKYSYGCNNEINILTNNQYNDVIKELLKKYDTCKIKSEIDDFDQSCIIFFLYENHRLYNEKTIKFINEYINKKKIIILVVSLDFDFDSIVKNSITNSIDAISWKDENGNKYKNYIIVLNKD